jgi:hypothetical protein
VNDDDLIDEVAKEMTAVPETPLLADRVMAQLYGTMVRRRRPMVLAPLGVMVTAALAIWAAGSRLTVEDQGTGVEERRPLASPASAISAARQGGRDAHPAAALPFKAAPPFKWTDARDAAERPVEVSATGPAPPIPVLPALAASDPIVITALETGPTPVVPLAIGTMEATPLSVEPLEIADLRRNTPAGDGL